MKYLVYTLFLILSTPSFGQITVEMTGGVGYDLSKFHILPDDERRPLSHTYTYQNEVISTKFTILEPRNVGVRVWYKIPKISGFSVGIEGRYSRRDILGIFSPLPTSGSSFNQLDINIQRYLLGVVLRKEINLNSRSTIFFQGGMLNVIHANTLPNGYSESNGLNDIPIPNRQLIRYRPDLDYYNLIEIVPDKNRFYPSVYQFSQGYLFEITPKIKIGVANSIYLDTKANSSFFIWEWDNLLERKTGEYQKNRLKFTNLMFDLSLCYTF